MSTQPSLRGVFRPKIKVYFVIFRAKPPNEIKVLLYHLSSDTDDQNPRFILSSQAILLTSNQDLLCHLPTNTANYKSKSTLLTFCVCEKSTVVCKAKGRTGTSFKEFNLRAMTFGRSLDWCNFHLRMVTGVSAAPSEATSAIAKIYGQLRTPGHHYSDTSKGKLLR